MTAFFRRFHKLLANKQQPSSADEPVGEGGSLAKIYGDNLSSPDALINRANKRAANGDPEGALCDFDEAIALNPTKPTAYFNRGFLFNALGKFEAAIRDFSDAIELLPDYDEAYYHRGNSHRQLGEFQRAVQNYSQAIRINPYCIKAYYKRAESRAELGDHTGALTDYSQVIMRMPKDANAYCQRGIFLSHNGELGKAVEDFSAAIECNPCLADAYFHRGYCLAQLGEAEKASQDFSKTLLHDPNHQAAYTRAYALGMLKEAPLTPPVHSFALLGNTVTISGEQVENLPMAAEPETYPSMLSSEANSGEGWLDRANHRLQNGDLGGAIADYTQVINQDPQNSQAYYQRGQSLVALGESQAAMEDLNRAIHWSRVHSLDLMRAFSGELSTTLKTLKQDLDNLSYERPFGENSTKQLPAASSRPQVNQLPANAVDIPSQITGHPQVNPCLSQTKQAAKSPVMNVASQPVTPSTASADTDITNQSGLKSPSTAKSLPSRPAADSISACQALDHAIAEQTRAIKQNPLNAEAFFHRGQSRALAGDLQGALEDYSRTIRLDPNNKEAYIKRARCQSALGNDAAAKADLNYVIRHQLTGLPNRPRPTSAKVTSQQSLPSKSQPAKQLQPQPANQPPNPRNTTLHLPLPTPAKPSAIDDAVLDMASLFVQENEILQSSQIPTQKACTHAGNSPGNQFCIYCGEPLDALSLYSSATSTPATEPRTQIKKPAVSNQEQRLQEAENYYDQGVTLFKEGDRPGSLQSLAAGLKIFLEQRTMQRYQQTLNLMQDVAHALNETDQDEENSDPNLLL